MQLDYQENNAVAETNKPASQTVDRAVLLLRLVAGAPAGGVRLANLAAESALDRATAFRLLQSLLANRLVEQDAATKRYTLGLDVFTMAAAAANRFDMAAIARTALRELSAATGDTAVLCLRSSLSLVCMDVEMGSFPIKALPMDIGSHRPFGAGAAGIAILAALPAFEADKLLQRLAPRLAQQPGQDQAAIAAAVAMARRAGHAFAAEGPQKQIHGLAVTLTNRLERPEGTIALYGIAERFEPARRAELLTRLEQRAQAINAAMWRIPDQARHRRGWVAQRGHRVG